ncbi:MAG: fibronectin type III domain-containing protein [Eubacteriaceae bacterium]|nr:fibronectin type III domain-containing protein [Eubacteriaceae bacterium]
MGIMKKSLSFILCIAVAISFCIPIMTDTAAAKTKVIKSASQLRDLHYKSKGFGPGSYKIGKDIDLGSNGTDACVPLIKGNYTIDFNGHTVMSSAAKVPTFSITGAHVTFKDSRMSSKKPSINSTALACVQIKSGRAVYQNGFYVNNWNGDNDCLEVSGGVTTIMNGVFAGNSAGIGQTGGVLRIANGTFYAWEGFGLMTSFNCSCKIIKGHFYSKYNPMTNRYGADSAIGILSMGYYTGDGSSLLGTGSSWSSSPMGIWFGNVGYGSTYCVSNSYDVTVNNSITVGRVSIKKPSKARKSFKAKWHKLSGASDYQVQYSRNKSMKSSSIKTVSGKKASLSIRKLKSKKKYYVRVRARQNVSGVMINGPWSAQRSVKTK